MDWPLCKLAEIIAIECMTRVFEYIVMRGLELAKESV